MTPTDGPGLSEYEDFIEGSYAWTEKRRMDENFIAGFLLGCLVASVITAIILGAIYV